MHYIIINPHTKYDYSSLRGFKKIFDDKLHYSKYGKKEILTNIGKKKMRRLVTIPRYNISLSTCIVNLATLACTRGLYKGIGMLKLGRMHRQTGEKFVDPTAMSRQMREVSDF